MEVNSDAVPSGASRKCNLRQWGHTVTFDGQNLALPRYKLRALSRTGGLVCSRHSCKASVTNLPVLVRAPEKGPSSCDEIVRCPTTVIKGVIFHQHFVIEMRSSNKSSSSWVKHLVMKTTKLLAVE